MHRRMREPPHLNKLKWLRMINSEGGLGDFDAENGFFAAHLTECPFVAHMFHMNGLLAICFICEITS